MPLTVYLDENFSHHIAEAFNSLEASEGLLAVKSTIPKFGRGAPDDVIAGGLISITDFIVTHDRDFSKRELVAQLIKRKIGVFVFRPPTGSKYWADVHYFFKAWPDIRENVLNLQPPFLFEFRAKGGLRKLSLHR